MRARPPEGFVRVLAKNGRVHHLIASGTGALTCTSVCGKTLRLWEIGGRHWLRQDLGRHGDCAECFSRADRQAGGGS